MTALLVDGSNVMMRALHAAGDSMSVDGINTGPTAIFFNMLARAVRESGATHMMVAFDHPDATFRSAFFPDYKAQRKHAFAREDVEGPFTLTADLMTLLGVDHLAMPGYEADDIIAAAWATWRRERPADRVVILSGDKDLLQLIDPQTTVLRPTTGALERWDDERVVGHFGVPASALATYLGLIGDISDNLPGLRGIGPKKAVRLIEEHGADFVTIIGAVESKHPVETIDLALVTYILVDLCHSPLTLDPLEVKTFPAEPPLTEDLAQMLDHYQLARLRRAVEDGTIWGARLAPQQQDILAEVDALDREATQR